MLSRWKNDVLGQVTPDVFIPIAEETGLICPLGDMLLRAACLDAISWPGDYLLAFNVSAVQLREPSYGLRLLSILAETGFSPYRLEIEITETAVVENTELVQATIADLRHAGVRVALDDFGTGYATLSHLCSLQVDKIKIDKSFVSKLFGHENGEVIIRAILGLAHGFGLTTTAEGIEDDKQQSFLKDHGCSEGQGYLFSRAMTADQVIPFLNGGVQNRFEVFPRCQSSTGRQQPSRKAAQSECPDLSVIGKALVPQTGLRTCDPVITNDVLYQLSYCGGPNGASAEGLKTPAPDIGERPDLARKTLPLRAWNYPPQRARNRASRRSGLVTS